MMKQILVKFERKATKAKILKRYNVTKQNKNYKHNYVIGTCLREPSNDNVWFLSTCAPTGDLEVDLLESTSPIRIF